MRRLHHVGKAALYPYQAEVSRTNAGSRLIKIVPRNSKGPSAHFRKMNIFIYDLASEMERRSEELNAKWVISVEAWSARIVVELASNLESGRKAPDEFRGAARLGSPSGVRMEAVANDAR